MAACAAATEDCVRAPEDGLEVVEDVGDVGVGVEFDVEYETRAASTEAADVA